MYERNVFKIIWCVRLDYRYIPGTAVREGKNYRRERTLITGVGSSLALARMVFAVLQRWRILARIESRLSGLKSSTNCT